MTDDRMTPMELLEKSGDTELLRDNAGLCGGSPDGAGDGGPLWRRARRAQPGAHQHRNGDMSDAGGRAPARWTAHPETQEGQLLPGLPGTAQDR